MNKRGVLIAFVLVGCAIDDDGPRPGSGSGSDIPPIELPPGVWEPFPGAEIRTASLAVDGDTLWWGASRRISPAGEYLFDDQAWLAATSARGDEVVAPLQIAPTTSVDFPDVVVTPSAIVAKLSGVETLLQRYRRDGIPLGAPYALVLDAGVSNVAGTDFIATAAGGTQYLAALGSDTHEVAVIDIDAAGVQQATRFAGVPDPEDGGTRAYSVSAAARADGSTVAAWDRGYNACISSRPSSTFTTTFAGAAAATPGVSVRDLPDSEYGPALAASGSAVYTAWLATSGNETRIALARYPAVTTVIAELAEPGSYVHSLRLVLVAPDRGVIAWTTAATGVLHVRPFTDAGDQVLLGAELVIPRVNEEADAQMVEVVHIGDGPTHHYAVGWIESTFTGIRDNYRLYATELYFSDTLFRPARPLAPVATQVAPRWLRCP